MTAWRQCAVKQKVKESSHMREIRKYEKTVFWKKNNNLQYMRNTWCHKGTDFFLFGSRRPVWKYGSIFFFFIKTLKSVKFSEALWWSIKSWIAFALLPFWTFLTSLTFQKWVCFVALLTSSFICQREGMEELCHKKQGCIPYLTHSRKKKWSREPVN